MLKSMTAYADAELTEGALTVHVEMRSYNHRHLDLLVKLPQGDAVLLEKFKPLVAPYVARGRLEIRVRWSDDSTAAAVYTVDTHRAADYLAALMQLKSALHLDTAVPLDLLVAESGCIQAVEPEMDPEVLWPPLARCTTAALEKLDAMRQREGRFIQTDFRQRLAGIKAGIDRIADMSRDLPALYRNRLKARIGDLVGDAVAVDAGRVEQEAALLAARSDITEEIVRVHSHLKQFERVIADPEPSGQRLNFLLQELFREDNTIGSKAGASTIAHKVVDIKAALEKLKEQVQNVE